MSTIKVKNPETGLWEKVGLPSEVKGMTMDLLWTNPNPTVGFEAQTIALDLGQYDAIYITAIINVGVYGAYFSSGIMPKNYAYNISNCISGNKYNVICVSRYVTINETGVEFGLGRWVDTALEEPRDSADVAMPVAIYGIKNTPVTYPEGGTTESITHPGCFYRMVNGVQEWLNPPMELGVEYKTTERYLGKPVYVAAIDCGNLPNASYKMVAIPNSTTVDFVIRANAVTSDKRTLPGASGFEENEEILCFANGPQVQFITRKDQSALTATATAWYIKTTD